MFKLGKYVEKVKSLESHLIELESRFSSLEISNAGMQGHMVYGEVYLFTYWGSFGAMYYPMSNSRPKKECRIAWKLFTKQQIEDEVGDRIKLFGVWHEKSNVIFYLRDDEEKRRIEDKFKDKESADETS